MRQWHFFGNRLSRQFQFLPASAAIAVVACLSLEMHDEIFHFEIFKNFMKFLKYFKTPFLNIS